MQISLYNHEKDTYTKVFRGDWDTFIRDVIKTHQYAEIKATSPAFIPAEIEEGLPRTINNVKRVWLAV